MTHMEYCKVESRQQLQLHVLNVQSLFAVFGYSWHPLALAKLGETWRQFSTTTSSKFVVGMQRTSYHNHPHELYEIIVLVHQGIGHSKVTDSIWIMSIILRSC